MHVMFIHPNFPGQFAHLALHLSQQLKWNCTLVTSVDTTQMNLPFQHINYRVKPGPMPKVFYAPGNYQGLLEHLAAVYMGLRSVPQVKPDLVVGHMSFGTMLYLRNLYSCPFVGYFEFLPPPFWSEQMIFRKEFPPTDELRLFNATYHALTYLHLHNVDAAYTPTHFQMSTAPPELRYKIRVIFDGVDCATFQPRTVKRPAQFRGLTIGPNTRVVTYVSRGLESIRGFDIFMKVAKRLTQEFQDIVFLIAGDERTYYGHEGAYIGAQSFKQYVLAQDSYDLSKFQFLGLIPTADLATLYNLSDLHIYLTGPYVLSWSMMQSLASGCTLVASDSPPVREVVEHEAQGLLADFYDVDGLTAQAVRVLRDPGQFRALGQAARQRVLERYELGKCLGQLVQLFEEVVSKAR